MRPHRLSLLLIHISFIFIAAGGICTALLARHGSLHLFPGESAGTYIAEDMRVSPLPLHLSLISFDIDYYPSSPLPRDYRSTLFTEAGDTVRISMNHIGRLPHGYRLYQTSYDEYGGTWLTVSHDPVGTSLAYFGFLLFTIGAVADIISRLRRRSLRHCTLYALFVTVASLGICLIFMNPSKEGQLPVLATWWLPVHVGFAAAGYVVLASTLPLAIAAIFIPAKRERLIVSAMRLTAPGVYLLGIGIIIGAMWANVSWGRYWGWDPKETWALITFIIYSIPLHSSLFTRHASLLRGDSEGVSNTLKSSLFILGALSIAMTYWGVSLLPSLHSYL